jgi:carboxypeptidase C (cathepsin A)
MADETATAKPKAPDQGAAQEHEPASAKRTWHHGDKTLDYVVTAEQFGIATDDGVHIGEMFMLSYVAEATDKTDRPVTFLWNGGPGGASYMVNIGGMGPVRVKPHGEDHLKPVADTDDNPFTLLTSSDLVFIDAMGTGYSVVDSEYDSKKVWGVDGDADAMVRGIILWLAKYDRFNSPLYLYGESYGTMRNAVVYRMLGEQGIGVTGVVEQSTILDYAPTLPGNDAFYLGMTPVYAATARFFGKAGTDVDADKWFDDTMKWVDEVMAPAIVQGDNLPKAKRDEVAAQMSAFIGLPADFIANRGLRIELDTYRRHLLKDEGKTLGRYDMRFTTYAYQAVQGDNEFYAGEDPSYDAINAPYVGAYRKMLTELGWDPAQTYVGLSMKVNSAWNWTHTAPGCMEPAFVPNVAYDLATALRRNPKSRIIFLGGRHDAATPWWNVRHDMSKLFLPEPLKRRCEYHLSSNGHMAYGDEKALEAIAPELAAFYEKRHED